MVDDKILVGLRWCVVSSTTACLLNAQKIPSKVGGGQIADHLIPLQGLRVLTADDLWGPDQLLPPNTQLD